MSNAILFRMQTGIPGAVSRESEADIDAQVLASGTPFPAFGLPGKFSAGAFVPVTATADVIVGFNVRAFPQGGLNASDALGTSVPRTSGIVDVLKRGRIMVQLNAGAGSAAAGSPAFVRFANPAGAAVVGGVEGALVASTTVAIAGAFFTGPADANGIAEVAFNI